MLFLTMTFGVHLIELQALVQFYIEARRWESSTINLGILTASCKKNKCFQSKYGSVAVSGS